MAVNGERCYLQADGVVTTSFEKGVGHIKVFKPLVKKTKNILSLCSVLAILTQWPAARWPKISWSPIWPWRRWSMLSSRRTAGWRTTEHTHTHTHTHTRADRSGFLTPNRILSCMLMHFNQWSFSVEYVAHRSHLTLFLLSFLTDRIISSCRFCSDTCFQSETLADVCYTWWCCNFLIEC